LQFGILNYQDGIGVILPTHLENNMNTNVKADPKAVAARRGKASIQFGRRLSVTQKAEQAAAQKWRKDHNLDPIGKKF